MAKHFIIWEDGVEDNIEVFNSEPVIVVHAAREDLDKLSSLDEANLPGVYVLYAGNTRYVGQASKSVYNRISQHDKRKPWWTNLVIIAREDGRLDKSQLDFMENRLIKDSMRADLTMDNGTEGNSSHIETYQKGKAQQVLVTGLRILEENAGVKLFKKVRMKLAPEISQVMAQAHPIQVIPSSTGITPAGYQGGEATRNETGDTLVAKTQEDDGVLDSDASSMGTMGSEEHQGRDESAPAPKRSVRVPSTYSIEIDGRSWESKSMKHIYINCVTDLVQENPWLREALVQSSRERGNRHFQETAPQGKERFYTQIQDDLALYTTLSQPGCREALSTILGILGKSGELRQIPLS